MTKAELLEQIKDIGDNDELMFYKNVSYYVEDPWDTFGGDTCTSTEQVCVDGVKKDTRRENSFRIIRVCFGSERIYCMKPFGKYKDDLCYDDNVSGFPLYRLNYDTFKKAFKTEKELINFIKDNPKMFTGNKTGKVLTERNIVWNDTKEIYQD